MGLAEEVSTDSCGSPRQGHEAVCSRCTRTLCPALIAGVGFSQPAWAGHWHGEGWDPLGPSPLPGWPQGPLGPAWLGPEGPCLGLLGPSSPSGSTQPCSWRGAVEGRVWHQASGLYFKGLTVIFIWSVCVPEVQLFLFSEISFGKL